MSPINYSYNEPKQNFLNMMSYHFKFGKKAGELVTTYLNDARLQIIYYINSMYKLIYINVIYI